MNNFIIPKKIEMKAIDLTDHIDKVTSKDSRVYYIDIQELISLTNQDPDTFFSNYANTINDVENELSFSFYNATQVVIFLIASLTLFMHFPIWTYIAEEVAYDLQLTETEVVMIFVCSKVSLIIATAGFGPMADSIGRNTMNWIYGLIFCTYSTVFLLIDHIYVLYSAVILICCCTNNQYNNEVVNIQESVKSEYRYALTGMSQLINLVGLFVWISIKSYTHSWKMAFAFYIILNAFGLFLRFFVCDSYMWLYKTDQIDKCCSTFNWISKFNGDGFNVLYFKNDDVVHNYNRLLVEQKIQKEDNEHDVVLREIDVHATLSHKEKYSKRSQTDLSGSKISKTSDATNCEYCFAPTGKDNNGGIDNNGIKKDKDIPHEENVNDGVQCQCVCSQYINEYAIKHDKQYDNMQNFIVESDIVYYKPNKSIIDKYRKIGSLHTLPEWPKIKNLIMYNFFIPLVLWTWIEYIPDYLVEYRKYLKLKEFNDISSVALIFSVFFNVMLYMVIVVSKVYTRMLLVIHAITFSLAVVILTVPCTDELKYVVIGSMGVMWGLSALEQSIVFYLYPITCGSDYRSTVFNLYELIFASFALIYDLVIYEIFYPIAKVPTLWANILMYIPIFYFIIMLIYIFGDDENDSLPV